MALSSMGRVREDEHTQETFYAICLGVGLMTLLSAEATQLNFDTQMAKSRGFADEGCSKGL